jgi:hypothetical protein
MAFPESEGKTELMSPADFVDVATLPVNDNGIRFATAIFGEP